MSEIDFSKEIEKILLNNNKHKSIIDNEKIRKNLKKWMISGDEYKIHDWVFTHSKGISIDDTLMGFSISGGIVIFSKNEFCITNGMSGNPILNKFNIEKFRDLKIERDGTTSDSVFLDGKRVGNFNRQSIDIWNNIVSDIIPHFNSYVEDWKKEEKIRLENIEQQRLKELKVSQTNVLSELDKDGNGEVDVLEGNDFNTLLKKHQKSIVEVDRNYVQQFVKVSSYLKTKKGNIQSVFNSIKDTPNQEVLNKYVEILKDEIHTYNLILFNSLNMIVSLVEDDMITFYEIHEMFDTLNMFDSKHEKDVSQKLINIGDGLRDLMYEIRVIGDQISNSMSELSYVTEESNQQLEKRLTEINSTMKVGNFMNLINTYQNYKTNRKLNS